MAIGGWNLDEHPPGGFDASDIPPFVSIRLPEVYNIPLRSLYSKDVSNLFMAGRNASCSHVAFTSTRVMATCAVMGQAAGTAAALCARHDVTPRQFYKDKARLKELQQTLLRDDQTIKGLKNEDPADLAPSGERHRLVGVQGLEARERPRWLRPRHGRRDEPPLDRPDVGRGGVDRAGLARAADDQDTSSSPSIPASTAS